MPMNYGNNPLIRVSCFIHVTPLIEVNGFILLINSELCGRIIPPTLNCLQMINGF